MRAGARSRRSCRERAHDRVRQQPPPPGQHDPPGEGGALGTLDRYLAFSSPEERAAFYGAAAKSGGVDRCHGDARPDCPILARLAGEVGAA